MYYNIYEVDTAPIKRSIMDANSLSEHITFLEMCAVVDDVENRDEELKTFGKWLKKENLGVIKKSAFVLNADAGCGRHFAERYARFHKIAEKLAAVSENDYCHCFDDVRNLTLDIKSAVVDDRDSYVFLAGTALLTMDEFLRSAKPGVTYHIGNICTFHC